MEMVRVTCFALGLALVTTSSAWGADFSLAIGNPVAVAVPGGVVKKSIEMAVRAEGCADPAKAQITGTAEGIVNGARQSVPLRLVLTPTAGAFAVSRDGTQAGVWVFSLTGHCGSSTASAIVPMGPNGFLRESSKFFPRAATAAEVEAVLKMLAGGAQ
jgi:hypothetical protein